MSACQLCLLLWPIWLISILCGKFSFNRKLIDPVKWISFFLLWSSLRLYTRLYTLRYLEQHAESADEESSFWTLKDFSPTAFYCRRYNIVLEIRRLWYYHLNLDLIYIFLPERNDSRMLNRFKTGIETWLAIRGHKLANIFQTTLAFLIILRRHYLHIMRNCT